MTDWISVTIKFSLVISILIALTLYLRSKPQEENIEKGNSDNLLLGSSESEMGVECTERSDEKEDHSQSSSVLQGSMQNISEATATSHHQTDCKPSDISHLVEGNKQLLSDAFSLIQEQSKALNRIEEKITGQLELINGVADRLGIFIGNGTVEQAYRLSDGDKEFIGQKFLQLAVQIETKNNKAPCNDIQTEEINKILTDNHAKFIERLKDILDSHGYKECGQCEYAVVPKNAKFCPDCGHSQT